MNTLQPDHSPGGDNNHTFRSPIHAPSSPKRRLVSSQCYSEADSFTCSQLSEGRADYFDQFEDSTIKSSVSLSQDDTLNDVTYSPSLSFPSHGWKKRGQDVEEISAEERYERLSSLLEKAAIFTEVVGGEVRKQQEKRRLEERAEEMVDTLKELPLTDISPNTDEKTPSGGPAAKLGQENSTGQSPHTRKRARTSHSKQTSKRYKAVRYYNNEVIPSIQPSLLTGGVLRDYQVDGYDWLRLLYENGLNGILADEMGLGKTIQTIALYCYLIERGIPGPFLIVAPLSTLRNWEKEFARFAPTIYTVVYIGNKLERKSLMRQIKGESSNAPELRNKSNKIPVVITHYGFIRIDFSKLLHVKWTYMVLDEGHQIKNYDARVNRCLNRFSCDNRLILTGTPIQNNLIELWSLLNFLMPAIFNDKNTFQGWFDVAGNLKGDVIDREREKPIIGMIQKIIRPFIMRRMKCDVSLNLPPKKEILVYCPLSQVQKNFYRALLDRTILAMIEKEYGKEEKEEKEVDEGSEHKTCRSSRRVVNYKEMSDREFMQIINGDAMLPLSWSGEVVDKEAEPDSLSVELNVSAVMTHVHLRKVVNHPYLIAHPYDRTDQGKALIISEEMIQLSGKMRILDHMLKQLIPDGHKVLIYSQWVRILDLVQDLMEIRDIQFVRLQGSRSLDEREESIVQFQTDRDIKCFLITTRAGGLGINLTAADTVIIFDSDWNPHVDTQAQDRSHRIGQTEPVIVYRLVAARTIDQKLVERAFAKKKLDKILINNKDFCKNSWTQNKVVPLKIEDLQELLTELEYDKQIGEGDDFTEEQMKTLLDRANLIEGVSNEAFKVVSHQTN